MKFEVAKRERPSHYRKNMDPTVWSFLEAVDALENQDGLCILVPWEPSDTGLTLKAKKQRILSYLHRYLSNKKFSVLKMDEDNTLGIFRRSDTPVVKGKIHNVNKMEKTC